MTIRAFREMTKKQLQVQIMRASKYDQEIPPTPEEIQQEYESTKEQYRDLTKDKIKFKKIFIPMLGDDSASTPEVQLNLAELIAKEIKSKNATFEEMAKRYSKDLYAEKAVTGPLRNAPRSPRNPPPSSLAHSPAKSSDRWWTPPASPSYWWRKRNWRRRPLSPPSRSRLTSWRATSAAMNVIKNGWNAFGKSHRQNIHLILLLSPLPDRPIQQGRSGVLSFIPPVFFPPTVPSALLLLPGASSSRPYLRKTPSYITGRRPQVIPPDAWNPADVIRAETVSC